MTIRIVVDTFSTASLYHFLLLNAYPLFVVGGLDRRLSLGTVHFAACAKSVLQKAVARRVVTCGV